jgi:hypothetical protein
MDNIKMKRYRAYNASMDDKLEERMAERGREAVGKKMLDYYQDRPGQAESDLEEMPMKNMGLESEAKMAEDTIKSGAMKRAKAAMDRIRRGGR